MSERREKRHVTQGRHKPTQADVAKLARVSPAVVSAVVSGRKPGSIRVSDRTREVVLSAVRELGYVPNLAARSLARGRNNIIGIFSYEPIFPMDSRSFYQEFLIGVEQEAEAKGYNLLMFSAAKDETGRRSIYPQDVNVLQLADGAVMVGAHESPGEILRLVAEGYPFVVIGRREDTEAEISFVAADYAAGTSDAVKALIAHGHRKIVFLRTANEHESLRDRRTGFAAACRAAGLPLGDTSILMLQDEERLDEVVVGSIRVGATAVVAESTSIAYALRLAARRVGVAIPRQLSLIGLGGAVATENARSIATLDVPGHEMGREAVRLLVRLLTGAEPGPLQHVLPCRLRLNRTVGAAPLAS